MNLKPNHKTIYLIPIGIDEWVWCDDPNPDGELNKSDAIEYIRADEILSAIGFRDHEVGIVNDICETENLSLLTLLRQSIRKFQGGKSISMTLDDYKNSLTQDA